MNHCQNIDPPYRKMVSYPQPLYYWANESFHFMAPFTPKVVLQHRGSDREGNNFIKLLLRAFWSSLFQIILILLSNAIERRIVSSFSNILSDSCIIQTKMQNIRGIPTVR